MGSAAAEGPWTTPSSDFHNEAESRAAALQTGRLEMIRDTGGGRRIKGVRRAQACRGQCVSEGIVLIDRCNERQAQRNSVSICIIYTVEK